MLFHSIPKHWNFWWKMAQSKFFKNKWIFKLKLHVYRYYSCHAPVLEFVALGYVDTYRGVKRYSQGKSSVDNDAFPFGNVIFWLSLNFVTHPLVLNESNYPNCPILYQVEGKQNLLFPEGQVIKFFVTCGWSYDKRDISAKRRGSDGHILHKNQLWRRWKFQSQVLIVYSISCQRRWFS